MTDPCKKFIDKLFRAVGSKASTDILATFNAIKSSENRDGGFFFEYYQLGTQDGKPIFANGSESGSIASHNARIILEPSFYRFDLGRNLANAALSAVHEIIHLNTDLGDGFLAEAVGRMKGEEYISDHGATIKGVLKDSDYWSRALRDACGDK